MSYSKRVLTIGSALITTVLLAACGGGAPVPENGAMPTVVPQDDAAQNPPRPTENPSYERR